MTRLEIPDYPFQAFIFDCDGTLVDSMPLHYIAWVEALKANDAPYEFTEDDFYAHAGIKEQDVVKILNARYGANVDPVAVDEAKMEIFRQRIPEVQAIDPVAAFAKDKRSYALFREAVTGHRLTLKPADAKVTT